MMNKEKAAGCGPKGITGNSTKNDHRKTSGTACFNWFFVYGRSALRLGGGR